MAAGPLSAPSLSRLSRADLCTVGREYMLAAHLQDRGSIPAVLRNHSMDEANQIAIEEWMTASPIYTRRMQRLLGFEGDDVETIFKGLQLDVGFPHQFMDVGYELFDATHGEFWLRSCGALADVTPMGHAFINGMCHDIEDPTFDATAAATNPYAQMRAIHRPPGVPRGGPDCHWAVTIDESRSRRRSTTHVLRTWSEAWSRRCLTSRRLIIPDRSIRTSSSRISATSRCTTVTREFAIQGHLLARALMCAVDRHYGADEAIEAGHALFVGIAWIASQRLARAMAVEESDLAAIATIIQLTHLLTPADYVGLHTSMPDPNTLLLTLDPGALGLAEGDAYSLPGLLALGQHDIIEALVHGVNPRAVVVADERTWTVTTPDDAEPVDEPGYVRVMRFSTGHDKVLGRRIPVRSSPS